MLTLDRSEDTQNTHGAYVLDLNEYFLVSIGIGVQITVSPKGGVTLVDKALQRIGKGCGNRIGKQFIEVLVILHVG
ncbi:hypothetical protein SDC9_132613 [bioreactor metagenome]|uniref:Uncharacterized protein n=1 Tax=bioreactor metagenome TaxID=1076179 RepID=A0A645DA90_9ZZZZ